VAEKKKLALSFDVECYYQIVAKDFLGEVFEPTDECLVNTNWILDELARHNARATFFFLGNIADKYPSLVQRAQNEGHEIGVHGYDHHYIDKMTRDEFSAETALAIEAIKRAGAKDIVGHRAPAFSINRSNLWALDVLKDAGLKYWTLSPEKYENGIYEIPMSVIDLFGRRLPAMGGGYVRYFHYAWTRFCAKKVNEAGHVPIVYFHPYEFAMERATMKKLPFTPARDGTFKRFRKFNFLQSVGRGKSMRSKLTKMIRENEAVAVGDVLLG